MYVCIIEYLDHDMFVFIVITVFRIVRKMNDRVMYLTSLELLRVNLAAIIFSPDVRALLDEYKDDVSRHLGIGDIHPLQQYLSHFWELLQLNNSVCVVMSS